MSVGKESIKRAASAGAKKTTAKEGSSAPVKTAEAVTEAAKPAKKAPVRKTAAKAAGTKKTATRKTAAKTVKTSVLTPAHTEELQAAFVSDQKKQEQRPAEPVHINEELPVYLL